MPGMSQWHAKFPFQNFQCIPVIPSLWFQPLTSLDLPASSSLLFPLMLSSLVLCGCLILAPLSLRNDFPRPTWADSLLRQKNKQCKQGRGAAFLGVLLKLFDLLKVKNSSIAKDMLTTFPPFSNQLGISL